MLKVNNKTRSWCEICSKYTIKTPKRRQQRHSGVFLVNLEENFTTFSSIDIEQVNVCWELMKSRI